MTSRDVTLLNSLVNYVLDVKPYHTKLKQFLSELFFSDSFNVNVTENLQWVFYHQNVWTRDDIGGYHLQRLCEGSTSDLTFRIPAAVWPHASLTDNVGQTPLGDDPALLTGDPVLWTGDYDPLTWGDSGPWFGSKSSSHFLGSDYVPGDPTKYRVPFHQGSRVYINGVQQIFGVDYVVDITRSFIKFAVAPGSTQHIEVQIFKVDRLFIAYNFPFDYGYTSDYFILTIDTTQLTGYQPPVFYNSNPIKNSKAELKMLGVTVAGDIDYDVSGYDDLPYDSDVLTVNGDVWVITAIGQWRFSVQNNGIGPIWYANFKEIFDNGQISFIIDRVWSDYYLVPDNNSYDSYDVLSFDSFDGGLDNTDFLVGLDLVTEHGVVTDPIPDRHRPMEFVMKDHIDGSFSPGFSIGKVKKITQLPQNLDYYEFVLTDPPSRGTYVELRVEQNGQLNPWLNTTIQDDMYLAVRWDHDTIVDQIEGFDIFDYDDHPYDKATTPPIIIPAGTIQLIHNVNIGGETIYEELRDVSELVLYHGRGGYASNVLVEHFDGALWITIPMLLMNLGEYFEGSFLPPDTVGIDKQRIVIKLGTPQTIRITLTF